MFAKTVRQNLPDWCELAPFVTFAYSTSRHSSTSFSPFYLLYLREPRVGIDLLLQKNEPAYKNLDDYSDEVRRKMQVANRIVENQLKVVFDRAKRRYDACVRSVKFNVGELCYFYSPRLFGGRGRKFHNQTTGPWKIIRKVNDVNYSIQKTPKSKATIVHVDKIMKYFGKVPKCWLEDEPMTVYFIFDKHFTVIPFHTEPDEWYVNQKTTPVIKQYADKKYAGQQEVRRSMENTPAKITPDNGNTPVNNSWGNTPAVDTVVIKNCAGLEYAGHEKYAWLGTTEKCGRAIGQVGAYIRPNI